MTSNTSLTATLPHADTTGAYPSSSQPPADDASAADLLLTQMADLAADDPRRDRLRNDVICACLPLARRLARRFRDRGEDPDDLTQVATLGLIKAVDRFDPTRGSRFVHYAVPTIVGELKRHFRDKGWSMRVSRRMQEMYLDVTRTIPTLSQQLGRSPSITDIATHLGATEEDVLAGMHCGTAYTTRSLNAPVRCEDGDTELAELVGDTDLRIENIADVHAVRQLVTELPKREQHILSLRFAAGLNQSQIAERVGVSQMHVSRLLNRSLGILRERMLIDA